MIWRWWSSSPRSASNKLFLKQSRMIHRDWRVCETSGSGSVCTSKTVDQDRLAPVDHVTDELQDRLEEGGEFSIESAIHLPPPERHVEDEVVESSLVEALDVGGAVDDGRHSSPLETREISGGLETKLSASHLTSARASPDLHQHR